MELPDGLGFHLLLLSPILGEPLLSGTRGCEGVKWGEREPQPNP